jgi:hypothetical protein
MEDMKTLNDSRSKEKTKKNIGKCGCRQEKWRMGRGEWFVAQ